jgi:hypothetical protein
MGERESSPAFACRYTLRESECRTNAEEWREEGANGWRSSTAQRPALTTATPPRRVLVALLMRLPMLLLMPRTPRLPAVAYRVHNTVGGCRRWSGRTLFV